MKRILSIALMGIIAMGLASCGKDEVKAFYTVTFDADGGTPVPEKQSVEEGKTAVAPSPAPTKTGFVFVAWSADGTNAYDFQSPVTRDLTLRARWLSEAQAEYWQVAWELNGGAWPSEGDNHATQVLKGGTLAEPAPPVKANHTFEGWYKEAALTNKVDFPYNVSGVTENLTLYAKWTEEDPGTPGIRICGRKLKEAGNVTGEGITGTIYYDGFKELTLDNATIRSESSNVGIEILNIVHDLNITLIGTNVIEVKKTGISCTGNQVSIHLSIKGSGSLTAKGKTGAGIRTEKAMLTIDGCSVTAEGTRGIAGFYTGHDNERLVVNHARVTATGSEGSVCGFTSIKLSECKITRPAGAVVNNGSIEITGNTVKTETTIEPVESYKLNIAGTQVTSDNASDILGNGTASYNAAQKTLTLNNAAITADDIGILNEGVEGLTIRLTGTNTIRAKNHGIQCWSSSHTTLTGGGTLTVESQKEQCGIQVQDAHLTIQSCTVYAKGRWGISGYKLHKEPKLLIEKATVKAAGTKASIEGFSTIELKGCKITQPENAEYAGGTVTVNGQAATGEVVIQ